MTVPVFPEDCCACEQSIELDSASLPNAYVVELAGTCTACSRTVPRRKDGKPGGIKYFGKPRTDCFIYGRL